MHDQDQVRAQLLSDRLDRGGMMRQKLPILTRYGTPE